MIRRVLAWLVGLTAAAVAALWLWGPREPSDLPRAFEADAVGADVDAWLAAREGVFDDITEGVRKQVVWQGEPGKRAPWAIVYLHGFSATSMETRPLAERVATAIDANVFYTRLAGHGRDGAALAEASVADWAVDLDEALAIGRRIGERVMVIGVSTGATLAVAGLDQGRTFDALVAISPNFRLRNRAASLLTWPGVRVWGPRLFGAERAFETVNDDHARFWTTRYPVEALLPMGALVARARTAEVERFATPALFVFDPADRVVDHDETRALALRWGGEATVAEAETGTGDDPSAHVIAGDILSPGMTDDLAALIAAWAAEL